MHAFDYVRAIMKERMRFQIMMASLTNEPVEPAYQVSVQDSIIPEPFSKSSLLFFRLQFSLSSTQQYRRLKDQTPKCSINTSSCRLGLVQRI